jgi:hypothetical protein
LGRSQLLDFTRSVNPFGALVKLPVDRVVNGGNEYSALLNALWTHSDSLAFDMAVRAAGVEGTSVWEVRLGLT